MNKSTLTFQDMLQLVELIRDSAAFSELRIRSGDLEIDLRRDVGSATRDIERRPTAVPPAPEPVAAPVVQKPLAPAPMRAPEAQPPTSASPASPPPNRDGVGVVKAPMVGTIYHAPEPGAAPFVVAGQAVEAGDQLCIIEVMKLMTPIRAELAGTVGEILVADGDSVEYGQALFVVTPRR